MAHVPSTFYLFSHRQTSPIEFQEAAFAPKIYSAKSFGGFFSQKQNFAHFSSFSNLRRLKNFVCPQLLQFVCVWLLYFWPTVFRMRGISITGNMRTVMDLLTWPWMTMRAPDLSLRIQSASEIWDRVRFHILLADFSLPRPSVAICIFCQAFYPSILWWPEKEYLAERLFSFFLSLGRRNALLCLQARCRYQANFSLRPIFTLEALELIKALSENGLWP